MKIHDSLKTIRAALTFLGVLGAIDRAALRGTVGVGTFRQGP